MHRARVATFSSPARLPRAYPGGIYRYKVEAAGRQITVDDVGRHELGTKVGLRIPLQRLHIFPATEAGIAA